MEITSKQKIKLNVAVRRYLADTVTPVTLYLKMRDQFTDPVLLESNDFGDVENCFSFIGLESIASIEVQNRTIRREREPVKLTKLIVKPKQR